MKLNGQCAFKHEWGPHLNSDGLSFFMPFAWKHLMGRSRFVLHTLSISLSGR